MARPGNREGIKHVTGLQPKKRRCRFRFCHIDVDVEMMWHQSTEVIWKKSMNDSKMEIKQNTFKSKYPVYSLFWERERGLGFDH